MLKKLSVFVVTLLLACTGGAWAADRDFSATIVTESEGNVTTSKICTSGMKSRMEVLGKKDNAIVIGRRDKNVSWMVMPAQHMYMEMPFRQDTATRLNEPDAKVDKKLVGSDKVDGHPCKKYHVTTTIDKKKDSGYSWEASDLGNMMVKYQTEDGKMTTTWKDIKFGGGSDDSLYEVPAGYKKMNMPSMPGQGGAPRPRHR